MPNNLITFILANDFSSQAKKVNFDILLSLSKLVSLSFFCIIIKISKNIVNRMFDVAFIHVTGRVCCVSKKKKYNSIYNPYI